MKRLSLTVVALAVLVGAPALADDELAAEGKVAPIFRLPAYNPQPGGLPVIGLERFVGPDATEKDVKAVLVSFMASYCAPCKKEMPYLQLLHERLRDQGLRVMMVSIDTEPEGMKIIDDLIALNKVTFPVLKDRFNLVARRWLGAQSPLPSVFVVKPDGLVAMVHRGYNEEASAVIASELEASLGLKKGSVSGLSVPSVASASEGGDVKPAGGTGKGSVVPAGGKGAKKKKAAKH